MHNHEGCMRIHSVVAWMASYKTMTVLVALRRKTDTISIQTVNKPFISLIVVKMKNKEEEKKKPNAGVEPATLRLRVSRSTD